MNSEEVISKNPRSYERGFLAPQVGLEHYATHGQKHSRLSHLRSKFSLFLPISCSLLHPQDALAINPVEHPSSVVIGELNCLRSKDITHFFTYAHLPFLTCKPYSQINFVDLDAEVEVGLAPYETDKFKA